MPKILHLADLHLGAPYDSLPPQAAAACRTAQLEAFAMALHRAADLGTDAVLIAGDLFDAPTPPAPLAAQAMTLLSKARCPVLIAPGNHDYLCPESPYCGELPENVHVFDRTHLEPFQLDGDTVVWGAAFCGTSAAIPVNAPLQQDVCNILLVHADLLTGSGYNPLTAADFEASGFTYAALGHNHEFSGLRRAGGTAYACPGSLMGRTAQEDGPRGYLLGEVSRAGVNLQWTPGGGVEFLSLTQPMEGIGDDRALGKAVAAQIPPHHSRICATLTLSGEKRYEPDLAALQNALAQVFLSAALRDESVRWRDPWRYAADDGLRGAVTRRFRKQYDDAADEGARAQALFALRVALAALEGEAFPQAAV